MSQKPLGLGFLAGASLATLGLFPQVALAQEPNGDESGNVIVVSATGRAELVQDVPLAVTTLNAETIEQAGVVDVKGLERIAPSFRFYTGQSNVSSATAYIRGLGTGGDNAGFEPAVGIFIDGVYRNRAGNALSDLPEVNRIEVLRGPQGTLFGRNTSAGAISIVTAAPEFDSRRFALYETGDLGLMRAQLGVTAPLIGDSLAYRLEVGGTFRDGYIEDVANNVDVNDRNRWSARGQLLWRGANGELRLITDVSQSDEACCGAVTVLNGPVSSAAIGINGGPATSVAGRTGGIGNLKADPEKRQFTASRGRDYREMVDEWGVSAQADYDVGGAEFTSITAYRNWRATRNQDVDFSDADRAYREGNKVGFETLTQEFRLRGEAGPLDWLVGAFYINEEATVRDTVKYGRDAALYADMFSLVGSGGAQLFGAAGPMLLPTNFPSAGPPTLGLPAGWTPNLLGAAALQQATMQTSVSGALGVLATLPAQQRTVVIGQYNALAGAFAALAPVEGQGLNADNWQTDTTGYALFTHNQFSISEDLTLTLGLRWNHEEKDLSADLNSVAPICSALQAQPLLSIGNSVVAAQPAARRLLTLACNPILNTIANGSYSDALESDEWTGTASLAYKLNDDLLLYGGYSRGYKVGGYNLDRSGFNIFYNSTAAPSVSDLAFEPEFVDAYEAGWKWSFAPRSYINGAIFLQQVSDFQDNSFSGFSFVTYNIPEVVSQGVELDFNWQATDALTLQAGVLYNDAFIDSDVVVDAGGPGEQTLTKGTKLVRAPEWNFTTAANYRRPLNDHLELGLFYDVRYMSEYVTQTLSRNPITDQDAFALHNARVGLYGTAGDWSVELWGRNLTDELYYLGAFAVPEQDNFAAYPSEPRTWGVTLRTSF